MNETELQARVEQLERVLAFYANKSNYTDDAKWQTAPIDYEGGQLARTVLGLEQPKYVGGFTGRYLKPLYEKLGYNIHTDEKGNK